MFRTRFIWIYEVNQQHKVESGELTGYKVHISGDNALVVAGVVFLASLGGKAGAVAAVVDEEDVAGASGIDEIREGGAYVVAGGLLVRIVGIDEDGDVIFGEAVTVDEARVHPPHIVDASFELGLGSGVVAADQNSLLRHGYELMR